MTADNVNSEAMRRAVIAALPRLRRFCRAMAGAVEDGDDLMQATVERTFARAHQFTPGTRVDSWMFRIAQNLHTDNARAKRRRGEAVPLADMGDTPGTDGLVLMEQRSDLAVAQRAIRALPSDQRAAFLLVVVEGMTYREAADALEVPVGTIMSRLARARKRIDLVVNDHAEGQP